MPKSDRHPDINPPTRADRDRGDAFVRDLRVRLGLPADPPPDPTERPTARLPPVASALRERATRDWMKREAEMVARLPPEPPPGTIEAEILRALATHPEDPEDPISDGEK